MVSRKKIMLTHPIPISMIGDVGKANNQTDKDRIAREARIKKRNINGNDSYQESFQETEETEDAGVDDYERNLEKDPVDNVQMEKEDTVEENVQMENEDPVEDNVQMGNEDLVEDNVQIVTIRGNTSFLRQVITFQDTPEQGKEIKNENQDGGVDYNIEGYSIDENVYYNVEMNNNSNVAESGSSKTLSNNNSHDECRDRGCKCHDGQDVVKIKMNVEMSASAFDRVAPIIFGAVTNPPQIVVNHNPPEEEPNDAG